MNGPEALTDWSLVRAFLAVADEGSFSGAARRLGSSQPTVGRQVQALEDALGTLLFHRRQRGMDLTEAGAALVAPARDMARAAAALGLAAAGRAEGLTGTVRITASVTMAHYVLPPILGHIRAAEPEIAVELVPTDRTENLLFHEADIAVRMFRPGQLDTVTRHLGDIPLGLFAARSYLDRAGRPQTWEEALSHAFVGYDRDDRMIRGFAESGVQVTRDFFGVRCDMDSVLWQLIRAGCGLGFGQVPVGEADPALERLLPDMAFPVLPVWLTAHRDMRRTPRVRRVWDMLAEGLSPLVS